MLSCLTAKDGPLSLSKLLLEPRVTIQVSLCHFNFRETIWIILPLIIYSLRSLVVFMANYLYHANNSCLVNAFHIRELGCAFLALLGLLMIKANLQVGLSYLQASDLRMNRFRL